MKEISYNENSVSDFRILGFATGEYYCYCKECNKHFLGDKRSTMCLECVIKKVEEKFREDSRPRNNY
jgi:hypothetical protein